ncbi:MAG: hypothetical protein ABIR70_13945 [Bryobacteraceae bacterium]
MAIIVLEKAARKGVLDSRALWILIVSSLLLAFVQTYYYGGASYGFDGYDQPSRLSSFITAQQFAGFLVVFLTLILWRRDFPLWLRFGTGSVLLLALALNGSRVWFFGATVVVMIHFALELRRASIVLALVAGFIATFWLLASSLQPQRMDLVNDSSNRIALTLSALVTGVDSSYSVGLRDLTFRTAIYEGVWNDLASSSLLELFFGHGTSSGAEAVLRVFPNGYDLDHLDPNRIVHNEWLRASYEWGIAGLLALIGVFSTLTVGLLSMRRANGLRYRASAALSFLGAFLLAFSGENILAGAGNAVTMSLALILALLWTPQDHQSRKRSIA